MVTDITRIEGQNTGGNKEFYFAPIQDVDTIPLASGREISGSITFKAGKGWLKCVCSDESRGYGENQKASEHGSIYTISISGFVRSDSTSVRSNLDLMTYMRFIALVKDNNNQQRLVGNFFEQLDFSFTFAGGSRIADLRGYQIEFSGDFTLPAPIYLPSL